MKFYVLAFAIKDGNGVISAEVVDRLFLSDESAHEFATQFIIEFKNAFLSRISPPQNDDGDESKIHFDVHFSFDYTVQGFDVGE